MKKFSKKIIQIAMLLFLVSVFTISCKKDTTTTPATASMIGIWTDASSGGKLIITSTKFSIYGSGLNLDEDTYTISSSNITLKTTSSLFCTLNTTCSYQFTVTSTKLSFTKVTDACYQRNAYMNVTYTRQ
ncbi:MAG: hypothetical protein WCO13_07230 [Bacteroidota bacterium]